MDGDSDEVFFYFPFPTEEVTEINGLSRFRQRSHCFSPSTLAFWGDSVKVK